MKSVIKQFVYFFPLLFIALFFCGSTDIRSKTKIAYQSGEQLKYLLHYGWIDGGNASLKIENSKIDNNEVLRIQLNGKTIGVTDKLYRVNDTYESFVNPENGLPLKSIRNIHEGSYHYYNEVIFNQENDFVISQKSGHHNVPDNTLDILSAFYFLRNTLYSKGSSNLSKDDVIVLTTFFGDEIYPLQIKYIGRETIKTKLGRVNCLKFQPVTEIGRVFDEEDDMTIWISNDLNYVPIRVEFELFIGSIKCDLIEFSGLKHNLIYL